MDFLLTTATRIEDDRTAEFLRQLHDCFLIFGPGHCSTLRPIALIRTSIQYSRPACSNLPIPMRSLSSAGSCAVSSWIRIDANNASSKRLAHSTTIILRLQVAVAANSAPSNALGPGP